MNIVLIQELIRFNGLLLIIKESINDVRKAISGTIIMSNSLEDVYNSMIAGKLPSLWASKSYPSLKSLANYITDLCARTNFFKVNQNQTCLKKIKLYFILKTIINKRSG